MEAPSQEFILQVAPVYHDILQYSIKFYKKIDPINKM